jgi:hypothetical protein
MVKYGGYRRLMVQFRQFDIGLFKVIWNSRGAFEAMISPSANFARPRRSLWLAI